MLGWIRSENGFSVVPNDESRDIFTQLSLLQESVLLFGNIWPKLCHRPKLLISRVVPFFTGLCQRSFLFACRPWHALQELRDFLLSYSMATNPCLSFDALLLRNSVCFFFFFLRMWKPAARHISFPMQWTFQTFVLVSWNQTNYMP